MITQGVGSEACIGLPWACRCRFLDGLRDSPGERGTELLLHSNLPSDLVLFRYKGWE
jgi:hypothetical protein